MSTPPLDTTEIASVLAKQAITEALYRYCRGLDRMDEDMAYGVWHADGTAHYSGLYEGTGRGFVDWVNELHRSMVATSHQVTNILIDVAPDLVHATSESYVTVRLRTESYAGALVDVVGAGRYLDQWSQRERRWAIDHRRYVGDFTTSVPVPAGNDRGRLDPAGTVARLVASRDTDDPSYHWPTA
ncbi:MAG: nuclear transport factor 2 family protein [Acidimicrobiales bacterium]